MPRNNGEKTVIRRRMRNNRRLKAAGVVWRQRNGNMRETESSNNTGRRPKNKNRESSNTGRGGQEITGEKAAIGLQSRPRNNRKK